MKENMLSKIKNKVKYIMSYLYIIIIIFISTFLNVDFVNSNEDLCILEEIETEYRSSNSETNVSCFEKRIIKVLLLYDYGMVLDKEWEDNIRTRFEEINKFYSSSFKIEWQIVSKQQFRFDKNIDNLSELFSLHKEDISKIVNNSKAEVSLSIIQRDIKGVGIAATFSNVVMVADSQKFNSYISSVVVAHEFGHLFGAWHTQRKNDFMLFSGAKQLRTSNESNNILKLMRNYNFDPETIINNDVILNRISRLYNRHHAKREIDPVARLLTDAGTKLYIDKDYKEAIKLLIKSNKYYGKWGETRMILSKNYYELDLLQDSFTEYTRAVFFGSKPDKQYENKLKKKFIDLQKIDPSINNPFILKN